jgi:LDH2 family malate/lactate/ureidoglycolate dehydrogenase
MMPLARDMIGIYIAVGSANHMPPWGGTVSCFSAPIDCLYAIPALEEPPIVLDIATSVTARQGKDESSTRRAHA